MVTEAKPTAAEFSIKIGGSKVSPDFLRQVFEVEVEQSLHLPDMFTIRVHLDATGEKPFDVVDDMIGGLLTAGSEVEIAHHVNNRNKVITVGEVTSVGLDLSSVVSGSPIYATIQGYDKSHRLHRGRITKTFINTKYSDIVSGIAGDAGLRGNVDGTKEVHDYIVQSNQPNWEFLQYLAARVGYNLYLDQGKLCFKEPKRDQLGVVELEWGTSLRQFRVRSSTCHQVAEVTVRGWDVKDKKEIVGKSTKGEGAATAACLCATSLGEDIGGSVRGPAANCGLTGIRPSWGRVSRFGVDGASWSLIPSDLFLGLLKTVPSPSVALRVMTLTIHTRGTCRYRTIVRPSRVTFEECELVLSKN